MYSRFFGIYVVLALVSHVFALPIDSAEVDTVYETGPDTSLESIPYVVEYVKTADVHPVEDLAAATRVREKTSISGVTTLSASQLASFAPYTQFARAAYCPSSNIQQWACGEACRANSNFQPTLVGGDGGAVQLYFVGYWPQENAVVVAHQGTDPTNLEADLTDLNIFTEGLDTTLFPRVPSNVGVHGGFATVQAQTAPGILAETKKLISQHGATKVICIGHSLGGAIASLDALFFTLNLPSSIHVKAVTYGTPRVGNSAWAQYFDSMVPDFQRINNESDLIPIIPGRALGYQHTHGEVHITSPGNAVSCPGNDDAVDEECTISTVPNIFVGNILDHLGPYQGIYIGSIFCY